MAIGDRIKLHRERIRMTQEELAKRLNTTPQNIYKYEKGIITNIPLSKIEQMAEIFKIPPERLTGWGNEHYIENKLPDNITSMPSMGRVALLGEIACGEPITAEENVEDYVDLPDHIKADFALRCRGDSMINARIFDGDIVYIRQQADVSNGEIAAVLVDSEATLKRVYHYAGRLELRPENPTFPVLSYEGEQLADVRIIGKAVAFTSAVR